MGTELREQPLVADAVTPVRYLVYTHTPLLEVVDLMVRCKLRAAPVVGERYEVLGLISTGDALRQLLSRRRSAEGKAGGLGGRAPGPDAEGHAMS